MTVKSRACRIAKEAAKERAKMEAEKERERVNMEEKRAKEEVQRAVPCRHPLPTHVLIVHSHTSPTAKHRQSHRDNTDKQTESGTENTDTDRHGEHSPSHVLVVHSHTSPTCRLMCWWFTAA